jgi:hypothetical protein
VEVEICAAGESAEEALELLAEDFAAFPRGLGVGELIHFDLLSPRLDSRFPGPPVLKTGACRAYGWASQRSCVYSDGTVLTSSRTVGQEHFTISGDHAAGIRETAWEAILSALGEALDRKHFHRIHALGLEWKGKAGLVILPSGGGKSTLGALLARTPYAPRLLSEETPLIRSGRVYPFPLRLGLSVATAVRHLGEAGRPFPRRLYPTKLLYPLPSTRIAPPSRAAFVLIGGARRHAQARAIPIGPFRAFWGIFWSMAIGVGVAQMREHLVRIDNLSRLATIFFSRVRETLRLARDVPAYRLEVSADPKETLRVVLEVLREPVIIPTWGSDHGSSRRIEPDADLHSPVLRPGLGEPEGTLPADLGGFSLGGAQPDHHVRGSEPDFPVRP